MANIVWENNGQGSFDFDYLLNLTSQKFVDVIADQMDSSSFKAIKICSDDTENVVDVIVVRRSFIRVYTWYSFNDSYESTAIFMDDLSWALEVINND